jgi:hypothetical protein
MKSSIAVSKVTEILNSPTMSARHPLRIKDCAVCGQEYETHCFTAKYCQECLPGVKSRRVYPSEDRSVDHTLKTRGDVLMHVMRRMARSCPGPKKEDCSTCYFNMVEAFAEECPKMGGKVLDVAL